MSREYSLAKMAQITLHALAQASFRLVNPYQTMKLKNCSHTKALEQFLEQFDNNFVKPLSAHSWAPAQK